MYKHQLAIIKLSTDISWNIMLEFCGTYYDSLRRGLEVMFEHNIPTYLFENADENEDVENIINTNDNFPPEDYDSISACTHIYSLRRTQPYIERSLQVIDKFVEDPRELAIDGGLELVQHFQA